MRRAPLVSLLAVLTCAPAASGQVVGVTLQASPGTARYASVVRFTGTAVPGQPVHVYERLGEGWHRVVSGTIKPGGSFRLAARVTRPGVYVARTPLGESAPAAVALKPRLRARLTGAPVVGGRLSLVGRILPAGAGTLVISFGSKRVTLRPARDGRFRIPLPARRLGGYRVELVLSPAEGYAETRRRLRVRIALPALALGSRGQSVRALEERLATLHYVLRRSDGVYGSDTYEAVLAFQKVHGMTRTGRVDRAFWRALGGASVPRPRAQGGDHIEVNKSRQVLYEVRDGKVLSVVHISTGATGNTPVGRWRVYRKVTGWDWVLWYPMYFLRGFAVHGYPSVPPYPASHGCVRIPMWFAPGLYSRWSHGATIVVLP